MNDWHLWLNSNETRTAIKTLEEILEELKETLSDGSHLQEKSAEKIALDVTYTVGQIDGMRNMIETLKEIAEIVDDD